MNEISDCTSAENILSFLKGNTKHQVDFKVRRGTKGDFVLKELFLLYMYHP